MRMTLHSSRCKNPFEILIQLCIGHGPISIRIQNDRLNTLKLGAARLYVLKQQKVHQL